MDSKALAEALDYVLGMYEQELQERGRETVRSWESVIDVGFLVEDVADGESTQEQVYATCAIAEAFERFLTVLGKFDCLAEGVCD